MSIKEKLLKLKALATDNPSAEEAKAAYDLYEQLLRKHNLIEDELQENIFRVFSSEGWESILLSHIVWNLGHKLYHFSRQGKRVRGGLSGKFDKQSLEIIAEMYDYHHKIVKRLVERAIVPVIIDRIQDKYGSSNCFMQLKIHYDKLRKTGRDNIQYCIKKRWPNSLVRNFVYARLGIEDAAKFMGDSTVYSWISEIINFGCQSLKPMLDAFVRGYCDRNFPTNTNVPIREVKPSVEQSFAYEQGKKHCTKDGLRSSKQEMRYYVKGG